MEYKYIYEYVYVYVYTQNIHVEIVGPFLLDTLLNSIIPVVYLLYSTMI